MYVTSRVSVPAQQDDRPHEREEHDRTADEWVAVDDQQDPQANSEDNDGPADDHVLIMARNA
jgi:hypothetical protein